MIQKGKKQKISQIYGIVFSVLTVVVGAVIILQLWGIYKSAPRKAFTRAKVAESLREIAPILWAWAIALIGNIVLGVLAQTQPKLKGGASSEISLARWRERVSGENKEVRALQIMRCVVYAVGGILIAAACIVAVSYLLDANYQPRFQANIFVIHNAAADRIVAMLPWAAAAITVGLLMSYIGEYTRNKQIALLKAQYASELKAQKEGKDEKVENPVAPAQKSQKQTLKTRWETFKSAHPMRFKNGLLYVRIGLCLAAVVLIILGVEWGGMDLVYEKARSICQQCIGLG